MLWLWKTEFLVLFYCSVTSHSVIFQLWWGWWWDGTVVHAVSNVRPAAGYQRYGQLGLFYVPSLPRHGDIWRHLWGMDKGVDISPPAPLPPSSLLGAARAQNFPRFPSLPFSPIVLPSPLPPPHFHLPPLVSRLLFTLRASQDLHVTSVLSFPNGNKTCVFQSLNNIMNNDKRPESLITCTWVSSITIVGESARKKYGRGQYVYLLQSRFVKYRSEVAPRKSRKRLSDSEVRDAILEDELARTSPSLP